MEVGRISGPRELASSTMVAVAAVSLFFSTVALSPVATAATSVRLLESSDFGAAPLRAHIEAHGLRWRQPHTTVVDGVKMFEWWAGDYKLTIYLEDEEYQYVFSWGPDMLREMEDGELRLAEFLAIWGQMFPGAVTGTSSLARSL